MGSTSIFPCTTTMISNFFMFQIFIFIFFYKYNRFLHFYIIPAALWLINSFFLFLKLIIFIACPLKNPQNFSIQCLPLCKSCSFTRLLNGDIVDIEKPDEICSHTFVVNEFSGLFLHPSIFSIIHSRSA